MRAGSRENEAESLTIASPRGKPPLGSPAQKPTVFRQGQDLGIG
jgi:hypothetical protein